MDTPIATILFVFADIIEPDTELLIVLRDMGDEFVAAKSDIKNRSRIKLHIELTQTYIRLRKGEENNLKLLNRTNNGASCQE